MAMGERYTEKELETVFKRRLKKFGSGLETIRDGSYVRATCKLHGTIRRHVTVFVGCAECNLQSRHKKHADLYRENLLKKHPDVKLCGTYKSALTKILHLCSCGSKWKVKPNEAMARPILECQRCAAKRKSESLQFDRKQFETKLREVHGFNYQLVGAFRPGLRHSCRFRCNTCHTTFKRPSSHLLDRKCPCPRCGAELKSSVALKNGRKGFKLKHVSIDGKKFVLQGYEPQAIEWILRKNTHVKVTDICTDHEGTVPTFRYKIGRRMRTYFPDIYIPKANLVVEVKSRYTLGLENGRDWRKNRQKAKAVVEAGYKFLVLVMGENGKRLCRLPKNWYDMSQREILIYCAFARGAADIEDRYGKSHKYVGPIKSFRPDK